VKTHVLAVAVAVMTALSVVAVVALSAAATASAGATTAPDQIGVLPPSAPAVNCSVGSALRSVIAELDYCRATEGVGPLTLPANFAQLTVPEQILTLINLERIDRGLAADIGLNSTLDGLAQRGAVANTDPGFPADGDRRPERAALDIYDSGGSIWAETDTVLDADLEWMYEDGPDSGNESCPSRGAAGCWGHRGIILSDQGSGPLVGGGGYGAAADGDSANHSFAFEQIYGYSGQLIWAWSSELPDFALTPGLERELAPGITATAPARVRVSGGQIVTVSGANLIGTTAVMFGPTPGTHLFCATETRCTVRAPRHAAGVVAVIARDRAGDSQRGASVTYV
jgi:hypothetical protein